MIKEAIKKLVENENLSYNEAKEVMNEIISGEASQIYMGAYLTALRMKGETIDEITASAEGMREHCVRLLHDMDVLEIVGTGGDEANTFNISTASSIVVSAYGIPVAKHGNRSVSSKCGAADVLEALGVKITITPAESAQVLNDIGLCFMFVQTYHNAMRFVAPVRKEPGIRTIFNILRPLGNPAGASYQLLGVYDESLVEPLAKVLVNLGVKRGMVELVREVTDLPVAIGFGIATPKQAEDMAKFGDGVIVGSAIVKMVAAEGRDCVNTVGNYVAEMKAAANRK